MKQRTQAFRDGWPSGSHQQGIFNKLLEDSSQMNSLSTRLINRIDDVRRSISPTYRLRRKRDAEVRYWRDEMDHLRDWFTLTTRDWWGVPTPKPYQKVNASDLWIVNAVMTLHKLRPSYHEELLLPGDFFRGKRVLEVGCGPLVPILQFSDCERHAVDPLVDAYIQVGWPLFAYDAKILNVRAEALPYPNSYFDAVISVNALDHVDDFEHTAREIERVTRVGGGIYFEVEYHEPTITEPITLTKERVLTAFSAATMNCIVERSGNQMFQSLIERFGLLASTLKRFADQTFATWHGIKV